ncbi:MAG: phosphoenolpyruvate carboxykinase (ATP) [Bdellovibrionales bacterium CG10_big_fil_rev_8_21_14_0_10_45_34]|nr:MAG: phosphoenolpyruvate carboxykinase (ATP) [Bdellovibrionales bacterium CG10_big_fil_rev_8_21_14_0_10_45_34]
MDQIMVEPTYRPTRVPNKLPYGALVVDTRPRTGRSTKERFVVKRAETEKAIDWGVVNQPIDADKADQFFELAQKYLGALSARQFQGAVGPCSLTVQTTSDWHVGFCQNMFRTEPFKVNGLKEFSTIQIFHVPDKTPAELGMAFDYDVAILLDPYKSQVLIVGTAYAGEIKKSAFTMMNYLLPEQNVLSMHASANCKPDGSSSTVLFGLSGTGKTTLSTASDRSMIGDDEIVWTDGGLFNLEGGCYAKLIDLDPQKEPGIFSAIHKPGAILENVVLTQDGSDVDFTNRSITENTRGSYSLENLDDVYNQHTYASQPENIVFLVADAFGALPAVAKLDHWQTQYHFVSGYTAKVAGTEMNVTEPQAVFSQCFGAPFMPRPAQVYAKLLAEKVQAHKCNVWLLNTGWMEGGYVKSQRYPISVSRALLRSIQDGSLLSADMVKHPIFGFSVPQSCQGIDEKFFRIPEGPAVTALAKRFQDNMKKHEASGMDPHVVANGGPRV